MKLAHVVSYLPIACGTVGWIFIGFYLSEPTPHLDFLRLFLGQYKLTEKMLSIAFYSTLGGILLSFWGIWVLRIGSRALKVGAGLCGAGVLMTLIGVPW